MAKKAEVRRHQIVAAALDALADIGSAEVSFNEVARCGITRGSTIYVFDPSGKGSAIFCGRNQPYPEWNPLTWT